VKNDANVNGLIFPATSAKIGRRPEFSANYSGENAKGRCAFGPDISKWLLWHRW